MERLDANTPAHQILKQAVDVKSGHRPNAHWRRPPGRPRNSWLQQINNGSLTGIRQTWRAAEDRGHHDDDDTMRHALVASNTASNAQISRILAFAASSHIAAQQKGEIPPPLKKIPAKCA